MRRREMGKGRGSQARGIMAHGGEQRAAGAANGCCSKLRGQHWRMGLWEGEGVPGDKAVFRNVQQWLIAH